MEVQNQQTPVSRPLVIVCGGRDYADASNVDSVLKGVNPRGIIHGGARGADSLAAWWARANDVRCAAMPAEWSKHGPAAGPIRNSAMLDRLLASQGPLLVVAFPGGRGTADMARKAKAAGVEVLAVSA